MYVVSGIQAVENINEFFSKNYALDRNSEQTH